MGWKGTEGGGVVGVVGMMIGESEDQPPCDRCCTEALPLVVRRRQLFSLLNVIVRHTSLMMKWDPSPASLFVLTTWLLWQVCGIGVLQSPSFRPMNWQNSSGQPAGHIVLNFWSQDRSRWRQVVDGDDDNDDDDDDPDHNSISVAVSALL